jgi:hypothetical protein
MKILNYLAYENNKGNQNGIWSRARIVLRHRHFFILFLQKANGSIINSTNPVKQVLPANEYAE